MTFNIVPKACSWLAVALSVPCLVSVLCFAPETPRCLLLSNDKSSCVDSLQWLRGHLSDLAGEFSTLSSRLESSLGSESLIKSLRLRAVYAPILLSLMMMMLTSLNSAPSLHLLFITNFSGSVLDMNLVIAESCVQIVGAVLAVFMIPRLGVKVVLLLGLSLSSAVYLFFGILSHMTSVGTGWPGLVSISMISLTHHLGLTPLRWFIMSELSPVHHISWSVSLSAAVFWSLNLVNTIIFPLLIQASLHCTAMINYNLKYFRILSWGCLSYHGLDHCPWLWPMSSPCGSSPTSSILSWARLSRFSEQSLIILLQ